MLLTIYFFRKLKSAARALYLNNIAIPESRLQVLREEVLKHMPPNTVLTEEILKEASEINI